ncbi:MAG: hypothetical protein Unbinned5081contig1000_35 [Prokaryotic dsDNA virus sp.]|nr:MAG: hypothetical protein Unbinned5081contig1000_35 [Prokaryotic dsDNA virus sp.]|tara:strand:- start:10157 stop:10300 length:144 start_codon:yes stop_codon:yes gene_type:complete
MGYEEFKQWLSEQDPDTVVDMLKLASEDIVDQFEDEVEKLWKEDYSE